MIAGLFNGCSFVWGDELIDPNKSRFSKLLSDHYSIEENNLSIRGASNSRIFRTTVDYIQNAKVLSKFAIIVWSGIDRIEYINHREKDNHDDYYLQCSPSRIGQPEFRTHRETLNRYYTHIRTDLYSSIETLGYMNTIQLLCESLNIPLLQFQFAHRHRKTIEESNSMIPINDRMERFLEYYRNKFYTLRSYSRYGLDDENSLLELSKSISDVLITPTYYGHPRESSQVLFSNFMIQELQRHYDIRV
jgi:hypothetical protein